LEADLNSEVKNSSGKLDKRSRSHFSVAVVTRTKNRGVLLRRAAESVASQTFEDYCWVVVNDGGDPVVVDAIIAKSGIPQKRVRVVHNEHSLGMEAASNIGIRQVSSEFIAIHDDDDSWDPAFLEKTVQFLRNQNRRLYAGVVTYSNYVSEVIRGEEIVRLGEKPYQHRLAGIELEAVIERNLFPPISFLFERNVWKSVGGFDETLPVLGDWLFNLEFLLFGDIGVLPETLAFYHHRDSHEPVPVEYRNTVVDQMDLHRRYTPLVRNRFMRSNLNQSVVSLRLAMQTQAVEPLSSHQAPRHAVAAPAPYEQLRRPDSDLTWAVASLNAVLAERRLSFRNKYRKLSPLPPNAPWSLVLPMLRKLDCKIPAPPDFDEPGYLRANPDVAAEVAEARQKSGYVHYLMYGQHEGRARSGSFGEVRQDSESIRPESHEGSLVRPVFDSLAMTRLAHKADGFDKVLHVAHHEWHGIRQATAYSPGHKLLISAHEALSETDRRAIAEQVAQMGIERVCFQGYSENADGLLLHLRAVLGPNVKFFMISHVTTAQFDNQFEMVVISRLLNRLRFGVIDGLASVKPGFAQWIESFSHRTIINYAPNVPMARGQRSSRTEVYAPLDVGWRKNLFTNLIAASIASNVDVVKTANFPNGLESVHDLGKLRLVGYLRGRDLFDEMARSSLTLIATLAECQPMTQLESFAVGTPALTGPLEVAEFVGDPLVELCTTSRLDNPGLLARDIERIVNVLKADPNAMYDMIGEHLARRHALASRNYAEFLEL
jgi:glycosyltransferase involved in cell wall biosynthesis